MATTKQTIQQLEEKASKKELTRKEYMEHSSELHHIYFCQFITGSTYAFIEGQIGLKKLLASKDEHMNDVCKWEQGGRTWLWDRTPINSVLAKELGEGLSMSTRTCIGKAAARNMVANTKEQSCNQ